MRWIDEEEGLDCEYLSKELISLYRYTSAQPLFLMFISNMILNL